MEEEIVNLGRVINVPGVSKLWERISYLVFHHLVSHFMTGLPEWKSNAIHQLEKLLINGERISWVEWKKLYELNSYQRLLQELDACLEGLYYQIWGSYDYVSFEHAHQLLSGWYDVNGQYVDKPAYWSAVYDVLDNSVVPAVQKWMEEVKASDPQWTNGEDWFNHPVFSWDEEKQETIFTSVKFISPFFA